FISDTDNIDSCASKLNEVIDIDEVNEIDEIVQDGEIKNAVKRGSRHVSRSLYSSLKSHSSDIDVDKK
ncbi:4706_t:CDS:2, partial [Racocetra fulgida]